MTPAATTLALSLMLSAPALAGPPQCGSGSGSCCEPDQTPGCDLPACCDVEWDGFCAGPNGAVPGCSWLELCQGDDACTDLTCDPGDAPEGEPCGADTNGGCNSTPTAFGSISCAAPVCGTAWADGGTRDTDWYEIATIAECTEITATLLSEFSGAVFVVDGLTGCTPGG